MKKLFLLFAVLIALFSTMAWGQILTFEFSALAGNEASANSNSNDPNLTSSTITRGSGVTAGSNSGRFNSSAWSTGGLDANDYVEFTITPNSNKKFSITSVVMLHQRSGTGPIGFAIRSSIDSYAADLATSSGTDVTSTQTATFTFTQSDLTTATTYRIYAYSAESSGGTWGPGDGSGDDITVNGSTGDAVVSEPTTQASNIVFSSVGSTQMTIDWTNGNGSNRVVVMKSGSAVDSNPVDATTYTASTTFGSGTQIGTGNYVVYNSSGTSVTVTGLTASTTYHVRVYEYNGSGGSEDYYTATATNNPNSQATTVATSSASDITAANNETSNINYASKQAASITATTDAVRVWSFTIRDGGGSADGDAFDTELTDITIGKGVSNGVTNWANTIRQAALYDGSTEVAEVSVTGETISFTGMSGSNVTATDGGSKTLDLYFTFETAVTDNEQFQFLITSATENPAKSQFAAADAGGAASSVTGDANKIEVTATVLGYVQQPSNVRTGNNMSPAVTVEANDANGNRDLDYVTNVSITATGATLTGSPVSATPSSGLATFSTLSFSTTGSSVTLDATSGSLTNAVSNTFTVYAPLNQNDIMITHLSADYSGTSDEFVVLFNNTGSSIDLIGYELQYYSSGGSSGSAGFEFTTSTVIPARSYILLSPNATVTVGSDSVSRDYALTSGLATSGQMAVQEKADTSNVIFAVAWGTITTYRAYMTDAATWSTDGMISLTASGNTYTRTSYNSSNTQYSHTASASIADIPNSSTPALPVELTSFTATARGRGVELAWKTATEVNNHGFEVERKPVQDSRLEVGGSDHETQTSNQAWSHVGFVQGSGTTNAPKEYSFTDKVPVSGKYLYRLKQVDNDGKFEYSSSVEVNASTLTSGYELAQNHPNPFNPTTTIAFALAKDEFVSLKVYDMLGKEIATLVNGKQSAGAYSVPFEASQLPSGIYFYTLRAGNNIETKKMLLVK